MIKVKNIIHHIGPNVTTVHAQDLIHIKEETNSLKDIIDRDRLIVKEKTKKKIMNIKENLLQIGFIVLVPKNPEKNFQIKNK